MAWPCQPAAHPVALTGLHFCFYLGIHCQVPDEVLGTETSTDPVAALMGSPTSGGD